MYKTIDMGDRYMMASSVAPPAHPKIIPELRQLSITHLMLAEGKSFKPIVDVIEKMASKDVEYARLQFLHFLNETKEVIEDNGSHFYGHFYKNQIYEEVVLIQVQNLVKGVDKLLKEAKTNPEDKWAMFALTDNMIMLEEGLYVLSQHKSTNQDWNNKKQEIEQEVKTLETKYESLSQLSNHYDNIRENLTKLETIKANVVSSITQQLSEPYHLSYQEVDKMRWVCGDRNVLWSFVQTKDDQKTDYYFPLEEKEAQELQSFMIGAMRSLEKSLSIGFINRLHAIATTVDYTGYNNQRKSQEGLEALDERKLRHAKQSDEKMKYRRRSNELTDEQEYLKVPKEQRLEKYKEDVIFTEKYATICYRLRDEINERINELKKVHNIQLSESEDNSLILTGDIQTGFVTGLINNNPNVVVLFHRDETVKHIAENAMYMVVLERAKYQELLDANKLVFNEDFKEIKGLSGSNFYSYPQMLQEMADPSIQQHVFGQEVKLVDKTQVKIKPSF